MWHKAIWKGHPMRLELTRVGLLVELANHYTTRGAFLPNIFAWVVSIHPYISLVNDSVLSGSTPVYLCQTTSKSTNILQLVAELKCDTKKTSGFPNKLARDFHYDCWKVWLDLVLWHINHCRLSNAKSYLYIYIKYMIFQYILLITFLNAPKLIFFVHSKIVPSIPM